MIVWVCIALGAAIALLAWLNVRIARNLPRRGQSAPAFTALDQNGQSRSLEEFHGKWLVLYFYPRDDTPGCAAEATSFRDAMRDIESLGATVCGVSVDSSTSHAAFARKYKLPFALLADRGGQIAARYGSLIDLGVVKFARRNTFLVDPQGTVEKHYVGVNPSRNPNDVKNDLARIVTAADAPAARPRP